MHRLFLVVTIILAVFSFSKREARGNDEKTSFSLEGPILIKADWSSEFLRHGDLNADGQVDFMTVNNRKSILEVFYRTENMDKPFELKKWFIEQSASDAVVIDLDEDGREDIVLAGSPCYVIFQGSDGSFSNSEELDFDAQFLLLSDLDDDDRQDILGIGRKEIVLAVREPSSDRFNFEIIKQPGVHAPRSRPFLADFNGDDLPDLAFESSTNRELLIVRFRNREMRFNPERIFKVGFNSKIAPLQRGDETPLIASVDENTETVKIMGFESEPFQEDDLFRFDVLQIIPFEEDSFSGNEHFLTADLDGNGRAEIYHFSTDSPKLRRYRINEADSALFDSFPVFTGVTKARPFELQDGEDRTRLLLVSPEEQAVGRVRVKDDGGISVPQPFDTGKSPLVADIGDMNGDGIDDLVVGVKDEKPFRYHAGTKDGDYASSPVILNFSDELNSTTDFSDLKVADINQDERLELIIFYEFGAPQIFGRSDEDATYQSLLDSALKRGFFSKIKANDLKLIDFDGDGGSEIVLLQEKFARVISMNPQGEIELVAQFNGKNAQSELTGFVLEDINSDGTDEVILLDRGNKILTVYKSDESGEILENIDVERSECKGLLKADANGDERNDLVLLGSGKVGLMLQGVEPMQIDQLARHATEVEDGGYGTLFVVDFNEDGESELLAYETEENVLEFFRFTLPDEWDQLYKFRVFQGEGPASGRFTSAGANMNMPREIETVDYTGDGQNDMIMLIHDLAIFYPQDE